MESFLADAAAEDGKGKEKDFFSPSSCHSHEENNHGKITTIRAQ